MLAFCAMAHAIAHLCWRKRGLFGVLLMILVSAQIWLVPRIASRYLYVKQITPYWLWAADWIMTVFGALFLYQCCMSDRAERFDNARMDGLGAFGVFRWSFSQSLGNIVRARTSELFAVALYFLSKAGHAINRGAAAFLRAQFRGLGHISALAALPLFAIFFLAKKLLPPSRSGAFQSAEE